VKALAANLEEVFREAVARWTLVAWFALSSLFVGIFAAAVNLDIVDGALAGVKLFGKTVNMGGRNVDVDRLVLGFESGFSAILYLVGTFLAVFATAHLVPRLQEKGTIDLYLSRPVGRVPLLLSRFAGGILLAAANVFYLIVSIWLIVGWKTGVWDPRLLEGGGVILFAIAALLAFAFLVGVATSSTAVSIMTTYALFFLSSILVAHEKIEAALSSAWSAGLVKGLYWVLPKTAQLGQAVVFLVSDGHGFRKAPPLDLFAVYGTTALFTLAALALASWLFSRKDF
jgi:ABC-type transport system involved in multi-copper enzyme maturation permease subunit